MQADVKTKNSKKIKMKALMNSECIHTGIDKQLVKDKRTQTRLINFSFEVFNIDGTKNREVTKVAPLEVKINRYKEQLKAAVIDLNGIDIFLGHNWLVKHNPEVNWKNVLWNTLDLTFYFFLLSIFLLILFLFLFFFLFFFRTMKKACDKEVT